MGDLGAASETVPETNATPVEAHATPLPDQLWAGVRQIVPPITAFAVAKGWIGNDEAVLIATVLGVLWPIVAGQLKVRRRAVELATVAANPHVPDEVARLR